MKNVLSIVRLQATCPPEPGGMEQHVRRLTDEQRALGHRVLLLFLAGDISHSDDLKVGLPLFAKCRPQALRSLLFLAASLWALIRERDVAVIHVHGDWSMALVGYVAKRFTGARTLMLSVHGGPTQSELRRWLQRRAFRLMDLIHTTGRRESNEIAGFVHCAVIWRPSGISNQFLCEGGCSTAKVRDGIKHLVVTTAVLRKKKNIDLVLDIALELPETTFVILGDGPERRRLERRVESEGISNVRLEGRVDSRDVMGWLDVADAYLSTSFNEGTPTAMLEAMARGVPVVTSRCCDFTGIMEDRVSGFIVDGYEAGSYAVVLRSLVRGEREWSQMHNSCLERAREFSWSMAADEITAATIDAVSRR